MPSIEDFVVVRSVSSGAFGKVVLAKHRTKQNDQLYAVKVMDKQHMLNKNMADRINKEKNALAITHSDYVVKIFYALESRSRIYLVMEYMVGGDLKNLLKRYIIFPQQVARFYVAECALALEYIHKHGIIHRDIKPDNILIGSNGHIKLTDFGLCNFKRENIDIADIIATPLNPARKLPARTPGQVLSLITNFRLTPKVDATYASTPTFVTAHNDSSTRFLSSIGEEFSTPQGGSDRYKSCVETVPEHESELSNTAGENNRFSVFGSSGSKRLFGESFDSVSFSSELERKRRRSDISGKRLCSSMSGESGSRTSFGSDVPSVFDLSLIRASTPQEDSPAAGSTPFGLNESKASEAEGSMSHQRESDSAYANATPLVRSLALSSKDRRRKQKYAPRRSVRFTSLSPSHTIIQEHNDSEQIPDANTPADHRTRLTRSVADASWTRIGRLKKIQAAKSQSGIVGTPDYLAPEILREEPHTPAVDVWSLGVCLYEFLVGCPPFIDETVEKVFANILARDIDYPEGDEALSPKAVETIEVLLDPHVVRRPSAVGLRKLPLFEDLDFVNIHNQEPPWIPNSDEHTGNSTEDIDDVLSAY